MSSVDPNDDTKKPSINNANSRHAIIRPNEPSLSSNCVSLRAVGDGTDTSCYVGHSKIPIPVPMTIPASIATSTISNPPASAVLQAAPCVSQFSSVKSNATHQPPRNSDLPFPTVPFPLATMLQPQLPQPLVVDSALLRQRQLAVAAASNIATHQPPQQSSYPHLRSGKWLPAEENYALLLVALFERGMIKDCIDGTTTLRTYLSQKLHCAPMRISKKFAGRGIGKLVYTSKAPSLSDQQKIPELLHRLRIAEQQFLQAAYPPPIAASLGAVPVRFVDVSKRKICISRDLLTQFHFALKFPLLQVSHTLQQPVPVFPSTMMPGMVANPITGTSFSQMVVPMAVGSSSPADAHTSELHKSYLRALEQADDDESNIEVPNQSSSQPLTQIIAPPLFVADPKVTTEMPDLLSGFEKIVQGMKNVPPTATHDVSTQPSNMSQDYSPPFTSRSFDDFHRFLGKDEISLLDTSTAVPEIPHVNQNSHVTTTTMDCDSILPSPVVALDTDALFTAESYALLVQANGHVSTVQSFPVTGSHNVYEVENILQQIQTHRSHHEPPTKSETMSTHSSYCDRFTGNATSFLGCLNENPPTDVTISKRPLNVGPLSNPSATTNFADVRVATTSTSNRNHHITATSQSEDANIVSGSEPSGGSSSSRSNTSNTSSGTDTAGTTSNEDDGSEEEGLTSSGGEFDSAEDDDNNASGHNQQQSPSSSPNSPPRKRAKGTNKHQHRSEHGKAKPKKVQFQ